jgi:hypothetical protein
MRLVTRSDFDGLVCAVLLRQVEQIDGIHFVHPKDLQDGKFAVSPDDALTNVPYVPGCGLWFDHHATEVKRVVEAGVPFHGACYVVPSAARVVYDFYGGTWTVGNVIVSDLRSVDTIYAGNQFLVYASWPGAEHLDLDRQRQGRPELRLRLPAQHPEPFQPRPRRRPDAPLR